MTTRSRDNELILNEAMLWLGKLQLVLSSSTESVYLNGQREHGEKVFNVPWILNLPFQMFHISAGKVDRALCVHYSQRIIFQLRNILKVWNSIMLLVGTSVRKQNNLQILLTGNEKPSHSQITKYDSSKFALKIFLNLANVPQDLLGSHFFPCLVIYDVNIVTPWLTLPYKNFVFGVARK